MRNATPPECPGQCHEYEPSLAFYRTVFGWNTRVESDAPEFRYSTVDIDEEQYAGVMDASGFLPEGVPAG